MVVALIGLIIVFMAIYNNKLDTKTLFNEVDPYFKLLKESDYEFYLYARYGENVDVEAHFRKRIKEALYTMVVVFIGVIANLSVINIILVFICGYLMYKQRYTSLKSYYKKRLNDMDLALPQYLKNIEILIQHYTIPVALSKSIDAAPEIFKPGLKKLTSRINMGDSSIDPYMEFANTYPVRDSMRMMRLLYRLSLGSQENKQEQMLSFSKTVSTLQNKAREQKYKNRLKKMENKTVLMLCVTGGGVMVLLLLAMLTSFV